MIKATVDKHGSDKPLSEGRRWEVYRCPACGGKPLPKQGRLECLGCGEEYPVWGEIVRFITTPEQVTGKDRVFSRFYNNWARLYDLSVKAWSLLMQGGEAAWRGDLLSKLEISRGDRVLEVSIGTGANLPYIGSFTCDLDIYGLDISLAMLEECRRNLDRWKLDVELCLGNAARLPYPDDFFDCVYHVGGINAFSEKGKAISEMVRVARPGTLIVISDETEKMFYTASILSRLGLPRVDDYIKQKFFRGSFLEALTSDALKPPLGLIPEGMEDIVVEPASRETMYVLRFRKPLTESRNG